MPYINRVKQSKTNNTMKWTLLISPHTRVEEEYPDGWSRDKVMEAAQGRWGGQVKQASLIGASKGRYDYSDQFDDVEPAGDYEYSDTAYESDYDNDSDYSSDSSTGLGSMFGSVIMVGLAIGGIVMFTGGDDNNYQPATSEPTIMEQVQKTFSDIAPAKDHPLQFNIRELPKSTPAQYRAEENGCDIWRKAQPALAAQLQPGDKCYR